MAELNLNECQIGHIKSSQDIPVSLFLVRGIGTTGTNSKFNLTFYQSLEGAVFKELVVEQGGGIWNQMIYGYGGYTQGMITYS